MEVAPLLLEVQPKVELINSITEEQHYLVGVTVLEALLILS